MGILQRVEDFKKKAARNFLRAAFLNSKLYDIAGTKGRKVTA